MKKIIILTSFVLCFLVIIFLGVKEYGRFKTVKEEWTRGYFVFNYYDGKLKTIELFDYNNKIIYRKYAPEWNVLPSVTEHQPEWEITMKKEYDTDGDGVLDTRACRGSSDMPLLWFEKNIDKGKVIRNSGEVADKAILKIEEDIRKNTLRR